MQEQDKNYEFKSKEFLNATIDEIYHRKKHRIQGIELLNFKCELAAYFVMIERTFRYCYFSDISLDVAKLDMTLFRQQFPFHYNNFANKSYVIRNSDNEEETVDGITYFFWFIERLRNINLHAVISTNLYSTMQIDEKFINCFPKISTNIVYAKSGKLTIAGMLIMLFSILDKSYSNRLLVYFLSNWNSVWGTLNYDGIKRKNTYLSTLFQETFQTNYEIAIRQTESTGNILNDLLGCLHGDADIEELSGSIINFKVDVSERVNAPWFGACGTLTKSDDEYFLTINQGSNIGKYFDEDYKLKIVNLKYFCEWSSCLPPLMLVAYCYHNNIYEFDSLDFLDCERLNKLRYAKFYRNKDLTILCAGSEYPDLREINKCVAENTIKLFLDFEESMVFCLNIEVYGTYSKLSDVLKKLEVADELSKRLLIVRNFCAHNGLLGNSQSYNTQEEVKIDLRFIVSAIIDFIKHLRNNNREKVALFLTQDLHKYVFNNIIGVKYRRIFLNSAKLFKETDADKINEILDGIQKSLGVVKNSVISGDDEKMFTSLTDNDFTFSHISPNTMRLSEGKYFFRELNLIIIQGKDIFLNGWPIKNEKCIFLETPNTNLESVTFLSPGQHLRLDKTEKVGILNKIYYEIVDKS